MTDKQIMDTTDKFVITGDVLEQLQYSRSSHIRTKCAGVVRNHLLSAELETAYRNGFNDGQAGEKKPRPPCEECIYQAQAAEIAKAEREKVLDEQDDRLFRVERLAYECIMNHPESKGFCSEIQTIIQSLRREP